MSRNPAEADFLRPDAKSPLASEGAGRTDPSLPSYVGAVPPPGTEPWDWTRTWQAPPPGVLLTVSQKPEDKGTYRTINDALAAAKRWATIRVLDNATYREAIVLENPTQHQGLCLEAPKQATIALNNDVKVFVIRNVPDVTVKGFLFQATNPLKMAVLVSVSGHCPGASLEHLDFQSHDWCTAIDVRDLLIAREERPLLVRGCRIDVAGDGITLLGQAEGVSRAALIRDNHVRKAARGILLQGAIADCHITGNVIKNCSQTGMQIQDPTADSHGILLANNTVYQCFSSLRVWQTPSAEKLIPGQASIRNNLLFDSLYTDLSFVQQKDSSNQVSGDAAFLYRAWGFDHNRRDRSGNDPLFILPLAAGDKKLDKGELGSLDPKSPDFLRPRPGSSLAQAGAGVTDPFLPRYVGALPPRTEEPWDWDRTWNARPRASSRGKAKYGDKEAK